MRAKNHHQQILRKLSAGKLTKRKLLRQLNGEDDTWYFIRNRGNGHTSYCGPNGELTREQYERESVGANTISFTVRTQRIQL